MLPYIAEFLGTMMLIILGDGVVANVNLNKSGMKGAGAVQITLAWGLAVLVPAFIFGEASGASFNPALTIALAVEGSFAWSMVPGYVIAQLAGAFVGASIVYLLFKGQFDATEDPGTKLGVFCTGPSIPNTGLNILSEAAAYMALTNTIPADKAEEIAMHKLGRKPELIELNRRAFRAGMDVIEKLKEAGECR